MKMETSLTAPFRGRVRQVLVGARTSRSPPRRRWCSSSRSTAAAADAAAGERVSFAGAARGPAGRAAALPREPRARSSGPCSATTSTPPRSERIVGRPARRLRDLPAAIRALVPGEHRLLALFADLRALSRPRHDDDEPEGELVRSPQEHLHAYLRSLDAEAEGLPDRSLVELLRGARHYGVESLDRTPALEEACYRLFLSQQRAATVRRAVLAILDRRLELADALPGRRPDFREALDRLVAATEGRDPVLADLAREVRFATSTSR